MNGKTIYFIFDAVNCSPNGDPDTGEQRINEALNTAVVSDLRIKRYARDKFQTYGLDTFYFYDKESIIKSDGESSGAKSRFETFCKNKGIDFKGKNVSTQNILIDNFLDVRVFGGILTSKENKAHVTGALQFNAENNSINKITHGKNLVNRGITTVFPSGDSKEQGSMARDSYLRYGLFNIVGYFNPTIAKINKSSDEDLKITLLSIWDGISSINTRSKYGQTPIACIVVDHKTTEVQNGFLTHKFPYSFKPFNITFKGDKTEYDLYSRDDYDFDFKPLLDLNDSDKIENITIYCDDENVKDKYFTNLPNKFKLLNPFDELLNTIEEWKK